MFNVIRETVVRFSSTWCLLKLSQAKKLMRGLEKNSFAFLFCRGFHTRPINTDLLFLVFQSNVNIWQALVWQFEHFLSNIKRKISDLPKNLWKISKFWIHFSSSRVALELCAYFYSRQNKDILFKLLPTRLSALPLFTSMFPQFQESLEDLKARLIFFSENCPSNIDTIMPPNISGKKNLLKPKK